MPAPPSKVGWSRGWYDDMNWAVLALLGALLACPRPPPVCNIIPAPPQLWCITSTVRRYDVFQAPCDSHARKSVAAEERTARRGPRRAPRRAAQRYEPRRWHLLPRGGQGEYFTFCIAIRAVCFTKDLVIIKVVFELIRVAWDTEVRDSSAPSQPAWEGEGGGIILPTSAYAQP